MLLDVKQLSISYNGTKALNDVSMEIIEGISIAIIGPNGSGKSSLLKGLYGVIPVNSGNVIYNGKDITRLSPRERFKRSMFYSPQGLDVFPRLEVQENLKLFLSEMPNTHCSLDEAFSFFPPLWEKRKSLAGNLSGGERRLLALTRAFMAKPKVLLLDEPSAGLAPAMVDLVVNKIKEILRLGTTLILVEQILSVALEITDYFYVLNRGKICITFSAKDFGYYKKEVKKIFLGQSNPQEVDKRSKMAYNNFSGK
jgi:branched-chain amino acid transport system ATP-binding protein